MSEELLARIAQLEDKLARITANRDDILREKRDLEGRPYKTPPGLLEAADRLIASQAPPSELADRVMIPRHCPPQEYQRLKAEAQRRGVPLVMGEEGVDPTTRNFARIGNSRVKFVETDATLYANQAMQRAVGIQALSQQAAAKGKALRIFRSLDDLDAEARAKHARIEEAGDPDSFVFEG